MSREWSSPSLEPLLKQLEDFCANSADQIRPLVAELQESSDEHMNRVDQLSYLIDRTAGKARRVQTDIMELKTTVRELRNHLLEQMAD